MAWKKVSPEMCEILEKGLAGFECRNKPMFGCPAYFVNDNWFAGVHQDTILIKLDECGREEFLSTYPDASFFEPKKGRPMREFVTLPEEVHCDFDRLQHWLERSYGYASSLPPKIKKPKKKKGA